MQKTYHNPFGGISLERSKKERLKKDLAEIETQIHELLCVGNTGSLFAEDKALLSSLEAEKSNILAIEVKTWRLKRRHLVAVG